MAKYNLLIILFLISNVAFGASFFQRGALIQSPSVVASAAGTTTLTYLSNQTQNLTGTLAQTFQLPDATTLINGMNYVFINDSTGALTVNNNSGTLIATLRAGQYVRVWLTNNGVSTGTWKSRIVTPELLTSHSNLLGLGNDDHLQYHTDARGDARYYKKLQYISAYSGLGFEPILTDSTGKIDINLLPSSAVNVSGPTSSTNNAIVLFNGTGGNVVKDSPLTTIDALGNITATSFVGPVTGTASGNPPNARLINTTTPITGGGDLSADRTIACNVASGAQAGCLSSADWTTFNGKGAGTVTSVAAADGSMSPILSWSSAVTGAGTLTGTLRTATANLVFAGPASGGLVQPNFRSLVGADLPNPSSTTLGGVRSAATVSNQWVASISTGGIPSLTQPAFTNISGTATVGQGGLGITTTPTNGTIPIGNGTNYVNASLTAGSNITITPGSGSITIAAASGTSIGAAGTMVIGGLTMTVSSEIILATNIFSNSYSSFYRIDGSTRGVYQVTNGKTFYADAICVNQGTASGTAAGNQLIYGTTNVGLNAAGAPTSPVGMATGVSSGNAADSYDTTAANGSHCLPWFGTAPQNTYPTVQLVGSHDVLVLYGHEI